MNPRSTMTPPTSSSRVPTTGPAGAGAALDRPNAGALASRPPSSDVRIHIESLHLHGIAAGDAAGVARALQTELARIADAEGVDLSAAQIETLRAERIRLGPTPEHTGQALARALVRKLQRE
jgi:hypothetical protein